MAQLLPSFTPSRAATIPMDIISAFHCTVSYRSNKNLGTIYKKKKKNQISDCGEWPFPCTHGKLLSRGGESITSGMGLSQIFTVTWCCVYKHSQWLPSNISCQSRQWQSEQKYVPCSPAIPAVKYIIKEQKNLHWFDGVGVEQDLPPLYP